MQHLEDKAKADGITVPFVGNHNNNYNTGDGAVEVDLPDDYPHGFDCSKPTKWNGGARDYSWGRATGKPLGMGEFQGGSFDPWGGPGYDACRTLTGPDFEKVFYKNNIAQGMTQQSFYMLYGGTSWGWQPDPSQVYSSYDYGAAITESRQLTTKYDEDKRIGYFTQAVAPLAKTDPLVGTPLSSDQIVDLARINPDDSTQFHTLRHKNSTLDGHPEYDADAGPGREAHDRVHVRRPGLAPDLHRDVEPRRRGRRTTPAATTTRPSRSATRPATASSIKFTGTAIRWISSYELNHGIADVYLDDKFMTSFDGYSSSKLNQQVFYTVGGLRTPSTR